MSRADVRCKLRFVPDTVGYRTSSAIRTRAGQPKNVSTVLLVLQLQL